MLFYVKKKILSVSAQFTVTGPSAEWSISGANATYVQTANIGQGILHGPTMDVGTYIDLFLNTGYEQGTSQATASVSFIGLTSTYTNFTYQSTTSNYAAGYWAGSVFRDASNVGSLGFALNGQTTYRISRTSATTFTITKLTGAGSPIVSPSFSYTNTAGIHLFVMGQINYKNSSCSIVGTGTL